MLILLLILGVKKATQDHNDEVFEFDTRNRYSVPVGVDKRSIIILNILKATINHYFWVNDFEYYEGYSTATLYKWMCQKKNK